MVFTKTLARGSPPLSLDDIRSVDAFRVWMLYKLDQNIHKGNRVAWLDPDRFSREDAVARLVEEVSELVSAVLSPDWNARDIILEAADVGNIAMMLADQTGELRTMKP